MEEYDRLHADILCEVQTICKYRLEFASEANPLFLNNASIQALHDIALTCQRLAKIARTAAAKAQVRN